MNQSSERGAIVAGLDLGTTKICAIIAERGYNGKLRIIGTGQCPSEGLCRGVVVDAEQTVEAIDEVVRQAELMAGVDAGAVYAGIAGEHIASLNSSGMVSVCWSWISTWKDWPTLSARPADSSWMQAS